MERIPRISRAQSMDALSSQSALAGYYAVALGMTHMARVLPKITSAAGVIGPAKVLVMGLGVAGLEAIATAQRLGAVVEGYDVRPATKEQALSLGATFVDTGVDATGKGGYARALTAEEKTKVDAALTKHIQGSDLIITTAAIPGKASPKLISKAQVAGMKSGAVIVDLSAEGGGNCEDTVPRRDKPKSAAVTIVAPLNVPSLLGRDASELYAKNQYNAAGPDDEGQHHHHRLDRRGHRQDGPDPRRQAVRHACRHAGQVCHRRHPRKRLEKDRMAIDDFAIIAMTGFVALYVFMLAAFAGWVIIGNVPAILHTPLMSGSNFVHGIVVVGGLFALFNASTPLEQGIGFLRGAAGRRRTRRRLRRHRPHAGHVQGQQRATDITSTPTATPSGRASQASAEDRSCSSTGRPNSPSARRSRARPSCSCSASSDVVAGDSASRHPCRRRGHGRRRPGQLPLCVHRQMQRPRPHLMINIALAVVAAGDRWRRRLVRRAQGRHDRDAADGGDL